jgi:hypothetical protein
MGIYAGGGKMADRKTGRLRTAIKQVAETALGFNSLERRFEFFLFQAQFFHSKTKPSDLSIIDDGS